ncbi:malonate decarboxylase holo-ACP synthase [Chromobacterium sp. Beijing]|uniref:malonate decarboxylase holo-ACP synthase n=1 Tax=Chromobacterium sp. Beijing TaxID=2735795 RepID=UPI001F3F3027|nr:malonate decarboxylase holo-ACP synthase [Chromobacterium sp. Beijing]UJB32167.1 malonate decarboxylase holo-ACP synthase [Chromobacterium sp. Beijing]
MPCWQAHDLLRVGDAAGLRLPAERPDWLAADRPLADLAVVRRDVRAGGDIPVGLRGWRREQRLAAWLAPAAVAERLSPESLLARLDDWNGPWPPALLALAALRPWMDARGWAWGPTGSCGFALASGLPLLREESDLDLLIRLPQRPGRTQLDDLRRLSSWPGCRLDIQIDIDHGGFALAEWLAARGAVLLKTEQGPRLFGDPWLKEAMS